jgi:hypothetical protein
VTGAYSLTVPAGCVISQDPAAGTRVAKATTVSLVISAGRQPAVAWHFTATPQSIWGTTVDTTADGGFIVGGGYSGAYDMYALRLNPTGGKVWDKQYSNRTPDANHMRRGVRVRRRTVDTFCLGPGITSGTRIPTSRSCW